MTHCRSEKQNSSLVTVNDTENTDRDRLTKVRVVLRKLSLEKLRPFGTINLNKKPFVRLKRVHVPKDLLDLIRKEYSLGTTYRTKLKVKVVHDEETFLMKEAHSGKGKKTEKLLVSVVQDSQTVFIKEISRHVFKRKAPDEEEIVCLKQVKISQKISVTTIFDADSSSIRDILKTQSVRKPIRRLTLAVRYLKPSKTEDNYGLGGKKEIDRDDVDRPIKQIPVWAEQRNYLEQMSSQADVDPDMIFAVCEPPDMKEMFPNSSNSGPSWDTPPPKKKLKKREKNGNSLEYFSRNLLTTFCSP